MKGPPRDPRLARDLARKAAQDVERKLFVSVPAAVNSQPAGPSPPKLSSECVLRFGAQKLSEAYWPSAPSLPGSVPAMAQGGRAANAQSPGDYMRAYLKAHPPDVGVSAMQPTGTVSSATLATSAPFRPPRPVLVAAAGADAMVKLTEVGRGLPAFLPDKQASADAALQEASHTLAQFSDKMFTLQQDQLELKRLRDADQLEIKKLKHQREEDQRERAARKAAKLQAAKLAKVDRMQQMKQSAPTHGTPEWIKRHWMTMVVRRAVATDLDPNLWIEEIVEGIKAKWGVTMSSMQVRAMMQEHYAVTNATKIKYYMTSTNAKGKAKGKPWLKSALGFKGFQLRFK